MPGHETRFAGGEFSPTAARVFISYRSKEPDIGLAQQFYESLQAAGHPVFLAGESIRLGDNWSQRVDEALEACDFFLLLLSPQSAVSEMVTEEVRRAKQLRDTRDDHRPGILPIRVNFPFTSPLNYDLRGYLQRIQQREWTTDADTPIILQEVLSLVSGSQESRAWVRDVADSDRSPASSAPSALLPSPYSPVPTPPASHSPPLPIAEPELPEGQVDLASAFYVDRVPREGSARTTIEAQCYEAIVRPGALIRIKAPRQMGKTSLMARILRHAGDQHHLTVPLSFQIADAAIFNDLDKFLKWFCASVGRRLRLPNKLADYWDDIFGSKDNCTAYFEDYLLATITSPLTLCLDEVDMVFNHPNVASDFFGLLRAWHEAAKNSDLWKKLRLVVVHSTEVYIPMNINQSPFNVGLPIELPEFTAEQVQNLAARHGLRWAATEIEPLMAMVGGHPYLVRVALYHVARQETTLNRLLQTAPTEAGLYGDHLRRHLWNLEQRPEMAMAVKRVVQTSNPVRLQSVQAFQLHSMGLVNLQDNDVTFRCELYRRYFGDRLG
ncbi:MAG: AAA-like domain-containing protein [Lyngbya sp. HA4199-MV5]|jgi:hypothetical protein|nr:AAA-like domain-containing protein [Lyngbya sp. HA4199-MV5]